MPLGFYRSPGPFRGCFVIYLQGEAGPFAGFLQSFAWCSDAGKGVSIQMRDYFGDEGDSDASKYTDHKLCRPFECVIDLSGLLEEHSNFYKAISLVANHLKIALLEDL